MRDQLFGVDWQEWLEVDRLLSIRFVDRKKPLANLKRLIDHEERLQRTCDGLIRSCKCHAVLLGPRE